MVIHHLGTKTIETERLILRRFVIEDAENMFKNWANDSDVCRFLSWNPHGTIEVTRELLNGWIAAYESENVYNWAVELKETGEVIGSIGTVGFSDKHFSCDMGYCISKSFWSKGIMTEALKALIKFFFTEVGLNRISAEHNTQNPASGRVMQKAGMTLEGTFRQRRIGKDGNFWDSSAWAILRGEYMLNTINSIKEE
jgi:ribosomal-protein-alanine N-acetyltransferase